MAIVGYEPNKKEGFLIHFTERSDAESTLRSIERKTGKNNNYQLRILGGTGRGQKTRVDKLVKLFGDSLVLHGKFIERDLYGKNDSSRSIALDTRDGKTYEFRGTELTDRDNSRFSVYGTPAVNVSE